MMPRQLLMIAKGKYVKYFTAPALLLPLHLDFIKPLALRKEVGTCQKILVCPEGY